MKLDPKHLNCPKCGEPIDHLVVHAHGKQYVTVKNEASGEIANQGKPQIPEADIAIKLGPKGRVQAKCENGHHWWAVRLRD